MSDIDKIWLNVSVSAVTKTYGHAVSRSNKKHTAHSKKNEDVLRKLTDLIKKSEDENLKALWECELFKQEDSSYPILKSLTQKQLIAVFDICSKAISLARHPLSSEGNSLSELINLIKDQSKYYVAQARFQESDYENIETNAFAENPSKEDSELVVAFGMLGFNITRNGNKWGLSSQKQSDDKKFKIGNKTFEFGGELVKNFVDNYLNSGDRKGRRITPEGVFTVYRKQMENAVIHISGQDNGLKESSLKLLSDHMLTLTSNPKRDNSFSMWDFERLCDDNLITIYSKIAAKKDKYKMDILSPLEGGDGKLIIENVILTNVRLKEKLEKLEHYSEDIVESIKEVLGKDNQNSIETYLSDYDNMLDKLDRAYKSKQLSDLQYQEMTKKLQEARSKFVKKFFESQGYSIELEGDEIKISHNGMEISKDNPIYDDVLKAYQSYTGNSSDNSKDDNQEEQEKDQEEDKIKHLQTILETKLPDVFEVFYSYYASADENSPMYSNHIGPIDHYQQFHFACYMFGEDNDGLRPFRKALQDYQRENNIATEEDALEPYLNNVLCKPFEFADSNGNITARSFYDKEIMKLAYNEVLYQKNPNKENKEEHDNQVKNLSDNFYNQLVMLDMATEAIARNADDYVTYIDKDTSPEDKRVLLKKYLDQIKPEQIASVDDAKRELVRKRYENGVLRYLSNPDYDLIRQGTTPSNESLIKAFEKYRNDLAQRQKDNDSELTQNGEKVVDHANREGSKSLEETKQQDPLVNEYKYGDKYPADDAEAKFLKAMKPYCNKYLIKNFIDPILKSIKNTTIREEISAEDVAKGKGTDIGDKKEVNLSEVGGDNNSGAGDNSLEENETKKNDQSSETNDTKQSADDKKKKQDIVVDKRQQDSMIFMLGSIICDFGIQNDGNRPGEKELSNIFRCVSSVDQDDQMQELFGKAEDGTDFRDYLRDLIFEIARGNRNYRTYESINKRLQEGIAKYNLKIEGNQFLNNIINGFKYITPEVILYLFAPTSKVIKQDGNTIIRIGELLKSDEFEEFRNCKTDQERRECAKKILESKGINIQEEHECITMLISEVFNIERKNGSVNARVGNIKESLKNRDSHLQFEYADNYGIDNEDSEMGE